MDPYSRDKIDSWVSDFCDSSRYATIPHAAKEYASEILVNFLVRACGDAARDPGDLTEKDVRRGLLEGAATLRLPASVKSEVPRLCQAFLEELEAQGRLAGGRALGRYVGALRPAFEEATADKPKPIVSKTSKLGRNQPCPCGSGKKYKKCCMGLLDG